MKRKLGNKLGILLTIVVGAYAMTACVVVDDDYICNDGEILIEAGDVSCDGYEDCYDGSDEWGCYDCDPVLDYECDDGECLINFGDISCDEVGDCEDFSDELGCGGCLYDEVFCYIGGVLDCAIVCDGDDECDNGLDEDVYYCN
jgi:hypothetical protein